VCDEEDFQEGKKHRENDFSESNSGGKKKRAKPTTAKRTKNRNIPLKRKVYTRQRKRRRR